MGGLLALSKGIDRVNGMIGRSASWLILIAVFVSAGNAIVRKLFNVSSNGLLELQWYLFGAAYMGAAAYTLYANEHIRIDLIYGRWRRSTQHWVDLLGHLFFLLPFAGLMVYYLYPWFLRSYYSGEVSTNASGLIIWPARLILLVGFVLLFAQGLSEVIKKIAIISGRIEDPSPPITSHAVTVDEDTVAELARDIYPTAIPTEPGPGPRPDEHKPEQRK